MKSILQTKHWADFKASQGFEILNIGNLFVHKRNLPYGQNFLYLPEVSSDYLTAQNMDEIKKLAKSQQSIFAKVELVNPYSANADKIVQSFGFIKSFEQVQPKWRHVIDISKSEDEVLSQMKSKGRYNVRLAQKKQVEVVSSSDGRAISKFHDLVSQTTRREKIKGRTVEYFQKMIDNFTDTDYLEIYIASYEGKPLAGALVSFYDGVASYLYGGSSSENREAMAPYAMHWQIIKDAKARGMKIYDMLGRSKPGDQRSKWAGVTRFKEQFGGEAVEILGSYDFIEKSTHYKVFKILERLRRNSG